MNIKLTSIRGKTDCAIIVFGRKDEYYFAHKNTKNSLSIGE
jgi:hypothetical protein